MASFKDIMALCLDGATYSAIAAALGCSRRDIAKVKTLIADHGITKAVSYTHLTLPTICSV